MQKPLDPGSNVHFLNLARNDQPHGDVLETLYDALTQANARRQPAPSAGRPANEQRIDGDGNTQLAGETAPRQSICGNNNIQIGAVQLVVNVMVNVER